MMPVIAVLYLQGNVGDHAPAEDGQEGAKCTSTGK